MGDQEASHPAMVVFGNEEMEEKREKQGFKEKVACW